MDISTLQQSNTLEYSVCCKSGDSCRILNIAWDVHYFVEAKGNVVKAHGTVYFASGMEKEALHSLCLLNMKKSERGEEAQGKRKHCSHRE